jgi:hypothetical protein
MTAIRPERLGTSKSVPQKLGDVNQAAATAFEGEIREFVRRDVAYLHAQRNNGEPAGESSSNYLNALIRRVSSASREEIDSVILELQGVRDMLQNEGERVSREIAGYASINHAALTAMQVIGDSLKQWKAGSNATPSENRPSPD